jgi:hypothetical protein
MFPHPWPRSSETTRAFTDEMFNSSGLEGLALFMGGQRSNLLRSYSLPPVTMPFMASWEWVVEWPCTEHKKFNGMILTKWKVSFYSETDNKTKVYLPLTQSPYWWPVIRTFDVSTSEPSARGEQNFSCPYWDSNAWPPASSQSLYWLSCLILGLLSEY